MVENKSQWKKLVQEALKDPDFAQKLRNPDSQEEALKNFGLEGVKLQKARDALKVVDMKAIEGFRNALDGPSYIPI
jgi:hypothetical protein